MRGPDVPVVTLDGPIGGAGWAQTSNIGRPIALDASAFADGRRLQVTTPSAGTLARGAYVLRVTVGGVPSMGRVVRFP